MGQKKRPPKETPDLREGAGSRRPSKAAGIDELSIEEIRARVRELAVHQVELERQNERLRQTQASLEEASEKYSDFFDFAPVGFLTLNESGVIQEANLTAAIQLGVTRKRLIHKPLQFFIHQADIERFRLDLKRVFQEPRPKPCEIRLQRRDGTGFYARLDSLAVTKDGGVQVCHTAITDISEPKQAEEKLKESQRLFDSFMANLPSVAVIRDLEGRYLFANKTWEETFHKTREEWLGKTAAQLWPPEVAERFKAGDRLFLKTGKPLQSLFTLRQDDGWHYWISYRFPIVDQDGRLVMIGLNGIDITKHLETKLRLERLLDSSPAAIYTCEAKGNFAPTYISDNVKGLVGWEPRQFLDNPRFWIKHVHPEDRRRVLKRVKLPWPQDHQSYEYRFLSKDGAYRWMHDDLKLVQDENGQAVEIAGAWMDITAAKQMQEALSESEAKFRLTFDQAPIGAAMVSPDYRFQRVNAELCRITGYSEAELTSRAFLDITHPEDGPASAARVARLANGEIDHYQVEKRYVRKDGETAWVRVSVRRVKDAQGAPLYFLSMIEDITERRQDKEALRNSEAKYHQAYELIRLIIDTVPDLIWAKDMEGRFLLVNKAQCQKLLGCDHPEEAVGKTDMFFAERERQAGYEHSFGELCADSDAIVKEKKAPCRFLESGKVRGQLLVLDVYKAPFLNEQGEMIGTVGCGRDITKEKAMEEALQESEKQYRLLVNQIPAVVFKGYGDWRVDFFDDKVEALTGYPKADFDSRRLKWCDLILPEDRERVGQAFLEALKTDKSYVREYRIRKKTGEIAWIQGRGQIFLDAAGRVDYISGVLFDITARKEADAIIRQERQRFFNLLDLLPAYVWLMAPDYTITFVNRIFKEIFGEPGGKKCFELMRGRQQPCKNCPNRRVLETQKPTNWEWTSPQGRTYHIYDYPFADIGGSPMVLELGIDITERKTLEAQLMQAQKMEAVGRLAGGVAHDFNNLLMAIMGYGELIRTSLMPDDPLYHYSEDILKAAERAASLTQQLLAFSRRQIIQPQVLNLNRVVADLKKMMPRLIGEHIDLEIIAGPDLGTVKADPGQIGQIIMNLAVNARDAMPTGGRLTLETANIDFAASHNCYIEAAPAGRYVELTVRDTGAGMDAATLSHIFEPFFTTKEIGKGTGLGLPTVFGIVKQNHGYIEVDSQPGQGTAFRVYLPRLETPVETPRARMTLAGKLEGSETILVVEDEDALRTLLCRFFRLYGYNVLEARHGGEALLICERHPEPIDLMVTDVVMPNMSGQELADRLISLHPEMKVFYMSGYTDSDLASYGVLDPSKTIILKPFRPMDLVKKVREFLDESRVK